MFPRDAKTIKLSKQAQAALGVAAKELEPEALITAVLLAPVDLLWFGGIGTYLKASTEANSPVGDPANDALRVDGGSARQGHRRGRDLGGTGGAHELRCKVGGSTPISSTIPPASLPLTLR